MNSDDAFKRNKSWEWNNLVAMRRDIELLNNRGRAIQNLKRLWKMDDLKTVQPKRPNSTEDRD